jgi:hypothetical protein
MPNYIDVATLKDISIVDFLARLGHHPVRKTGKEHFYHSMLRENQKGHTIIYRMGCRKLLERLGWCKRNWYF